MRIMGQILDAVRGTDAEESLKTSTVVDPIARGSPCVHYKRNISNTPYYIQNGALQQCYYSAVLLQPCYYRFVVFWPFGRNRCNNLVGIVITAFSPVFK